MLKVNHRNTENKVWNMSKVNNEDTRTSVSVVNFEHVIVGWEVLFVRNSCLKMSLNAYYWAHY